MKWKQKKKRWIDKNSKKNGKIEQSKKYSGGRGSVTGTTRMLNRNEKYYELSAPENFSLYNNHEETAAYLTEIYNAVKKGLYNKKIFLDFENIKTVGIESIVYIIAILKNVRLLPYLTYEFQGNFPKDENAKRIFEESGFLKYVRSGSRKLPIPKNNDKIQIISGNKCDTKVARDVCDFIMNTGLISLEERRQLFIVMIELMSNTVQHAYNKEEGNRLLPAWYLFCQYIDDNLFFNFVDIGDGIPDTIHKKWGIQDMLLRDSDAIMSAMNGELRSETGKAYRGKGLPFLKENIENGTLRNFKLVSEKGSCLYDDIFKKFITYEYKNHIFGTIFYWEMGRRTLL